jgi:hypothetical protein
MRRAILRDTTMGNRAAWNRINKARKAEEDRVWLAEHIETLPQRNQAEVTAEDRNIAARRAAFPLC